MASPSLKFKIPQWTDTDTLGDSAISAIDNGLYIDGCVGIGTSSPNYLLDVESSTAGARIYNTTTNGQTDLHLRTAGTTGSSRIFFGDTADSDIGSIIYRHNGNSLAFETNDEEQVRIDSDGNVGIGETVPGVHDLLGESHWRLVAPLYASGEHSHSCHNRSRSTVNSYLSCLPIYPILKF